MNTSEKVASPPRASASRIPIRTVLFSLILAGVAHSQFESKPSELFLRAQKAAAKKSLPFHEIDTEILSLRSKIIVQELDIDDLKRKSQDLDDTLKATIQKCNSESKGCYSQNREINEMKHSLISIEKVIQRRSEYLAQLNLNLEQRKVQIIQMGGNCKNCDGVVPTVGLR